MFQAPFPQPDNPRRGQLVLSDPHRVDCALSYTIISFQMSTGKWIPLPDSVQYLGALTQTLKFSKDDIQISVHKQHSIGLGCDLGADRKELRLSIAVTRV